MAHEHGLITEEALEQLRARLGKEWVTSEPPHFEVATRDAIRHFAWGMGDGNPLWTDPDYASKTRYGCVLAPPCMLYAMDRGASGHLGGGLPGVHAMFSGTDWEWFLPIKENDRISCTGTLSDVIEKERSSFSRRMVHQGFLVEFRNQDGELVARAKMWAMRTERAMAKGKGKYSKIRQHPYTPGEIRAIEADYDREAVRGAEPRYWEDVVVGEEVAPIVKGPLTVTDVICWKVGWGGNPFVRAHGLALRWRRRHPGVAIPNRLGIPDVPERVHWEDDLAREVGVPAAYDYGPQRISWLGNLITNWMGDEGFLRKLSVQVRRFNLIGDTTWCKGKVVDKYPGDGEHLVECEVWAENQRREVTASGQAVVRLPRKARFSPRVGFSGGRVAGRS